MRRILHAGAIVLVASMSHGARVLGYRYAGSNS